MVEGYNFVGLPQAEKRGYETASDVCGREITPTTNVTKVYKNENRLSGYPGLTIHECGNVENNFELKEYTGYFLFAENPDKPGKRYGELKLPKI